jgi:hypothetical protein
VRSLRDDGTELPSRTCSQNSLVVDKRASKGSSFFQIGKTDSDKADLYVEYQIATDQERQWNAYGTGGGWRFGGGMAPI